MNFYSIFFYFFVCLYKEASELVFYKYKYLRSANVTFVGYSVDVIN